MIYVVSQRPQGKPYKKKIKLILHKIKTMSSMIYFFTLFIFKVSEIAPDIKHEKKKKKYKSNAFLNTFGLHTICTNFAFIIPSYNVSLLDKNQLIPALQCKRWLKF